jgi:DNA-3-methyladenine glycosylase
VAEPGILAARLGSPLARSFFEHSPDRVARALLGKLIVRRDGPELLEGRIVETEAYCGMDDPAAHSFAGRTARTEVLFGPPGHAYVYLIYGMHYCLNVSCEPEGQPGCALIRALEPVAGLARMAELRGLPPDARAALLANGPGKLCRALGVTRLAHNGVDVTDQCSSLVFTDDGEAPAEVVVGPRVGIRKAVDRPARFYVAGSAFVSRR